MEKRCDDFIIPVEDVEVAEEAPPQPSDDEEKTDEKKQKSQLNFEDIDRDPNPPFDAQLYSGVFLDGENKKLYWVDEKTNKNCFMLFARNLVIVNESYWEWEEQPLNVEGRSDGKIEIVRLKEVCWLEVTGGFNVSKLSSKTWYIVLLEVRLDDGVDAWSDWSRVWLVLPEFMNRRVKHEHKVNMKAVERGKWVEIPIGVFNTSIYTQGKIDLEFIQFGDWISGIEIRSVKIQPLEEYS